MQAAAKPASAHRPDILTTLKAATHHEHVAIESVVPLMQAGLTRAVYRGYLARLYGFYEPIERCLAEALDGSSFASEFDRRRKLPLLARDLLAHGATLVSIAGLPRCPDDALPPVVDSTAAFGVLYVLEGSTLGGRLLTRHLEQALDLDPARDCAFLSSEGGDIGASWRAFGAAIEDHAKSLGADDIDRLVAAARATFVSLRLWIAPEADR